MRAALAILGTVLLLVALFVRSYSLPPAPDRRGGMTIALTWPNRPVFGSPRADCLGTPEAEPAIGCVIASVNRARAEGVPLLSLPFSPRCYTWSERIARIGLNEAAVQTKLAQIARFGW